MVNTYRLIFAIIISSILSIRGYKRQSLSIDGALIAFLTGLIHSYTSNHFTFILAIFFLSSSWATRYQSKLKKEIDPSIKAGGQRNAIQVLANSLTASILCFLQLYFWGPQEPNGILYWYNSRHSTIISIAIVAHYACCNGDTWASEFGILDKNSPYFITKCKQVPRGTNGATSITGTFASLLGGLVIGFGYYLFTLLWILTTKTDEYQRLDYPPQYPIIFIGALAGLIGSIIDSILGATLQYSAFDQGLHIIKSPNQNLHPQTIINRTNILDNNMVNFLASQLTVALTICIGFWQNSSTKIIIQ